MGCAWAQFWPVDGTSAWDRAMDAAPGQDGAFTKRRSLARVVETSSERCRVSDAGGRVAGFVLGRGNHANRVGDLENLAVNSDCQGQGIAGMLMHQAIAAWRTEGPCAIKVFAGLDLKHEAARRLSETLGLGVVWHTVDGVALDSD